MKLSDFNFDLPKELIAQYPSQRRGDSRLLVIRKNRKEILHSYFRNISDYLDPDDLLILNNTRVIPARLAGKKELTGGKVEVLLTEKIDNNRWRSLIKPNSRVKTGATINFNQKIKAVVLGRDNNGQRIIKFNSVNGTLQKELQRIGMIPLPPYIKRDPQPIDSCRYQTIYASKYGAIAAPTAGLHFTKGAFIDLKKKGVKTAYITLHVNYATFRPVREEDISKHRMGREFFEISPQAIQAINKVRKRGSRLVAVGTTSCRTLETIANNLKPVKRDTDLFIYHPYKFKLINALMTNFHLPRTTLLMLVSAFCGHRLLMKAYQEAIDRKYRFFSYGDAMLIV